MNNDIQLIIDAIKRQEHHNAENLCWAALKKQPNSSQLQKWLGISLLQQKKYIGCVNAFLQSLPEMKDDFDVINNLAFAYRHLEDYENAILYLNKAELLKPNHYSVAFNRASIYFNLKKYDMALEETLKCFKLIKDVSSGVVAKPRILKNLYVEILFARNNFDEAIAIMTEDLENKNEEFNPNLFYNLSNAAPEKISDAIKFLAKKSASNEKEHYMKRAAAYLGLGRLCEKEKDYKAAFENYAAANKIKAEKLRYKPFLAQEIIKKNIMHFKNNYIEEMYKNFSDNYMKKGANVIFVVGNPRSGTTLVESILGSSEDITSAGELLIFNRLVPEDLKSVTPKSLEKIGDEYLRILKNFDTQNKYKYIIDKMPSNIYHVGLIRLCLPSAKIICLNRRPLDNAWSIFTQFYLENIPYSSSLFNIGLALANVDALKRVWASHDRGKNFLLVDYEKMVTEPQKSTEEIYNFVKIDAKYDEEKRKKFSSSTASKTQIKKDIYTSSVSRSKVYDSYLEEFEKSYTNQSQYWNKYLRDQKII